MASINNSTAVDLTVGEDLNGDVYELLIINASGRVVKPTATTGVADEVVVGVLAEDPGRTTVDGTDSVPVALIDAGGILACKAGGTITAGDILIPDATSGRAASGGQNPSDMADTEVGFGIALESAVDGDVFEFLAARIYRSNDAA